MPTFSNCKPHIDTAALLKDFYVFFLKQLLGDKSLILRLFGEKRTDVHVICNGFYYRSLLAGGTCLEPVSLKIQRVLVISDSGERLYTRALLPGLIIPYSRYSLQLILYCLCLHRSGLSVNQIYARTGVSPYLLRTWIRKASCDHGITAFFLEFLKTRDTSMTLSCFFRIPGISIVRDQLVKLYSLFSSFPGKWSAWFPDRLPPSLR